MSEQLAVTDDYAPEEFRNWRRDPYGLGRIKTGQPCQEWHRETEGRSTLWEAKVWEEDGQYVGRVWRTSNLSPRRARLRMFFSLSDDHRGADGTWTFGYFSSAGRAIAFTERWIEVRRDRATWQNPNPPIDPGDRYVLRVVDEEKALEWPNRRDGLELAK